MTDVGRLIGSLIIVLGVGIFGTLTGFLANFFLAPSEAAAAAAPPAVEADYTLGTSSQMEDELGAAGE